MRNRAVAIDGKVEFSASPVTNPLVDVPMPLVWRSIQAPSAALDCQSLVFSTAIVPPYLGWGYEVQPTLLNRW